MFSGGRVYQTLAPHYPLLASPTTTTSAGAASRKRGCFETFPHAITCAILGRDMASAKMKKVQRRDLVTTAGIQPGVLESIDAMGAALCAYNSARCLLQGGTRAYGNAAGG